MIDLRLSAIGHIFFIPKPSSSTNADARSKTHRPPHRSLWSLRNQALNWKLNYLNQDNLKFIKWPSSCADLPLNCDSKWLYWKDYVWECNDPRDQVGPKQHSHRWLDLSDIKELWPLFVPSLKTLLCWIFRTKSTKPSFLQAWQPKRDRQGPTSERNFSERFRPLQSTNRGILMPLSKWACRRIAGSLIKAKISASKSKDIYLPICRPDRSSL